MNLSKKENKERKKERDDGKGRKKGIKKGGREKRTNEKMSWTQNLPNEKVKTCIIKEEKKS